MRLENREDLNQWLKGEGIVDKKQDARASDFRGGVVAVMKKIRGEDLWRYFHFSSLNTFPWWR